MPYIKQRHSRKPVIAPTKPIFTIYAQKGAGKTALALGVPGNVQALSFDGKTVEVWEDPKLYDRDERITVWDMVETYSEDPEEYWTKSASDTFDENMELLNHIEANYKVDWFLIDCLDVFTEICEMKMRKHFKMDPFQGFAELGRWKKRKLYMRQFVNRCLQLANEGIIITAYPDMYEYYRDGPLEVAPKVPKWTDYIMQRTDVTIRVETTYSIKERQLNFQALIYNAKGRFTATFPTGSLFDINGIDCIKLFWDGRAPVLSEGVSAPVQRKAHRKASVKPKKKNSTWRELK